MYFIIISRGHFKKLVESNDSIWWKINGDKKLREMEFWSRQTFACREVSNWQNWEWHFRNARKCYRVDIVWDLHSENEVLRPRLRSFQKGVLSNVKQWNTINIPSLLRNRLMNTLRLWMIRKPMTIMMTETRWRSWNRKVAC